MMAKLTPEFIVKSKQNKAMMKIILYHTNI